MKNFIRYVWLLSLFLVTIPAHGRHIVFNHLTTADGLSQCTVNDLYIDEYGTIWIATREGLNRYNGLYIQAFHLQKENPYSLFCNHVQRITGDGKGKLFLLCTEGVAEYDLVEEKFHTLLRGSIYSIYYHDHLYIGRQNEILRYNEQNALFESYYTLDNQKADISCFHIQQGKLYIGTMNHGVYCLTMDTHTLTHPIAQGNIPSIYGDKEGDLWIGSWEEGLYRQERNGELTNYRHDPHTPSSLSSNFVRACCEDNFGNLWIGTADGLDCYNRMTGLFSHHSEYEFGGNGLTHSSVWDIVRDAQGTLWVGTYFGGVNYFNPEYEIFSRYNYSAIERKGLSYPVVGRMVADDEGNLWIGTEGGGLNCYHRKQQQFSWFKANGTHSSLSHNNVKSLFYDSSRHTLWIGTHLGGLNRLDLKTGRFQWYRMKPGDPHTLPSDIVRDIVPYEDKLVIATQKGVVLFHPDSGESQNLFSYLPEGEAILTVVALAVDHQGTLWMAVNGKGIYSYRFDTRKLTNYRHREENPNSLSSNNVNNLFCDSEGNLWIATAGSGLDRYRPESDDFENYDQQRNGLADDCIYRVEESKQGERLLLITNSGFSTFDKKTHRFSNYSQENGFPLTGINENALCVTPDGEVFVGSTEGVVSFYEQELDFPAKPYRILPSRLTVNGKEVQVDDDSGVLRCSPYATEEITLQSHQSMFSVEFATTNHVVSNDDELIYRLQGFSNEWNRVPSNHTVTYTNLNPGTYQLVVKPAHAETLCPPAILTIHVQPPYYKTWWAYLIYLTAITILLSYLIRTYQARIKLSESLKYEQQHLKDIEALNQSKLRFFTNISHEFRTPLTLIVSQVEMLMQTQNFTPLLYNKVLGIYKNSLQLRELITELLDFRKQEQGHMKIKVSPHNIIDFLYENYLLFQEYAHNRQIELRFEHECDKLEVWYDQKQMLKVVNNLLSNAFKHSQPKSVITLGIRATEGNVLMWVSDTGCGIAEAELAKVFDRFYQVEPTSENDAKENGTGIGLALTKGIVELHHGHIHVESRLGEGTCFQVYLPLGREAFSEEEISHHEESIQQPETLPATDESPIIEEVEERSPQQRIPNAEMLIVEDNDSIREMLMQLFAPFYHVVTARDGQEGWEQIERHAPHIVVSDVVMPRMSGTELCKRIKEDYATCHIPVVLLTARTAIEQNLEGLRIGADDYITKPFHTSLLIARCNNLVNSRLLLQERYNRQPQADPQMLATNPLDKELLDRAISIIEAHLADAEFNVNVFAREMGIARTNLFTKLKAVTGQTPNDFILSVRLKKAAWMLRNHAEWNVTEIADKTGFSTARYFAKCFKEIYHVSPMAYRRGEEPSQTAEEYPE